MIEIARLPADDRRELFHNTAAKTGLHDAIVEKDFWVCLTLDDELRKCLACRSDESSLSY